MLIGCFFWVEILEVRVIFGAIPTTVLFDSFLLDLLVLLTALLGYLGWIIANPAVKALQLP